MPTFNEATRRYLIVPGPDDLYPVKLVDETTWLWIHSPPPSFDKYAYEFDNNCPEYQRRLMYERHAADTLGIAYDRFQIKVSEGRYKDDRALAAIGVDFASVDEALAWASSNNVKVADRFYPVAAPDQ